MIGTRDEAVIRFASYVSRARGSTSLVYEALRNLDKPTDEQVFAEIDRLIAEGTPQRTAVGGN